MKSVLLILLVTSQLLAAGPRYQYDDPHLNDEIANIYKQIQYPQISTGTAQNFTIVNGSFTNLSGTTVVATTGTIKSFMVVGTGANDTPLAGRIGERISSTLARASSVNGVNGNFVNITSIVLTAGHWCVTGQAVEVLNSATSTAFRLAVSSFSANTSTDHVQGDNDLNCNPATGAYDMGQTIGCWPVSINSPTTIYLKGAAVFSAGTPILYGRISAVRDF
jgi:hypothetical protein